MIAVYLESLISVQNECNKINLFGKIPVVVGLGERHDQLHPYSSKAIYSTKFQFENGQEETSNGSSVSLQG